MSTTSASPTSSIGPKEKSNLALRSASSICQIFSNNDDDRDADSEPLKLGPKADYVYHIKLELPAKYTARAPLPFSLKRDYAEYQATLQAGRNHLHCRPHAHPSSGRTPRSPRRGYEAFRRAVGSDLGQFLSVEKHRRRFPHSPRRHESRRPRRKRTRRHERRQSHHGAFNFSSGQPRSTPKTKYAWNLLAAAYIGLRQNDDAVAALKKQIEINPYDEYAYNALGRAYWQERKYDDAVAAFNKQIEINPLDKFAHAGLGSMYSEWKKIRLSCPGVRESCIAHP